MSTTSINKQKNNNINNNSNKRSISLFSTRRRVALLLLSLVTSLLCFYIYRRFFFNIVNEDGNIINTTSNNNNNNNRNNNIDSEEEEEEEEEKSTFRVRSESSSSSSSSSLGEELGDEDLAPYSSSSSSSAVLGFPSQKKRVINIALKVGTTNNDNEKKNSTHEKVQMSSELNGNICGKSNAINGRSSRAFHGSCEVRGVAISALERDPWMKVYINDDDDNNNSMEKKTNKRRKIWSVEVFMGLKKCNSIKFAEGVLCDQVKISDELPMVIELILEDLFTGEEVIGDSSDNKNNDNNNFTIALKKVFTDEGRMVYTWDNIDMAGELVKSNGRFKFKGVKISLPSSSSLSSSSSRKSNNVVASNNRQLQVQEVKIWAVANDKDKSEFERSRQRCLNDKIGDDCLTDLNLDWVYLPQSFERAREIWNEEEFKDLARQIQKTQSPEDGSCKRINTESYNVGMGGKGAGFASTLHFLSGYLSDAFLQNKAWVFGGRLNYAINSVCDKKNLAGDVECYFKPYSLTCLKEKKSAFEKWKPIKTDNNRCAIPRNRCRDLSPWRKVPEGSFGKRGMFWFRSAIVSHMMRLNAHTEKRLNLNSIKQKIGFKKPLIGVHIRRGDACHTTGRKNRCRSFEEQYLPHIKTLSEKYGITRVFLATDDSKMLNAIMNSQAANEFDFVHVQMDRSVYANTKLIERRTDLYSTKSAQADQMMLQALTDTFLLAETDAFVGHFLSNLSRLAIELSAAFKGYVPPFISVDGQWCRHWKFCR